MTPTSLKIVSYNVNGIRAAIRKGFVDWLDTNDYDIICIQETKAQRSQVDTSLFEELGYHHYWYSAEKKGYSGVAILSKIEADQVVKGCGIEQYDKEGRILRADFGDLTIVSVYIPSGSSGDARQAIKIQFLDDFYTFCQNLKSERPKLIVAGDYNICHKAIDIHNPVQNKNTSGFLPEERAWMDKFFENGFIDTFRHFNAEPDNYSWWSYRANSRARNKGWRIDYAAASTALEGQLISAGIFPDAMHSDHCPVGVGIVIEDQ